jgi:hypothetical protein
MYFYNETKVIYNYLASTEFKQKLELINMNYPNLKQELFIRNAVLEYLNHNTQKLSESSKYRAFAEHPRGEGATRVDLSIIEKETHKQYLVEFKFQFPYDIVHFEYDKTIKRDFEEKNGQSKTSLFVLFVADWDANENGAKNQFDKEWGIDSNLSRYQKLKHKEGRLWTDILKENFSQFEKEGVLLDTIRLSITEPYPVDYYIYLLERISM